MSQPPRAKSLKVGLFDSGVGGLSVLSRLQQLAARLALPMDFLYLGDTARCPYGGRTAEEIREFVAQIGAWLVAQGAEQIVMACNTSAALAAESARSLFAVPVLDLIEPASRRAAAVTGKVAVLATEATVRSRAFSRAIRSFNGDADVSEIACPELVPLLEAGLVGSPQARAALRRYLAEPSVAGAAAVLLGCTHYPFLAGELAEALPYGTEIIDPALCLAESLLQAGGLCPAPSGSTPGNTTARLFVTGAVEPFAAAASACLGSLPGTVYGITLDQLAAPAYAPGTVAGAEARGALNALP